uniref:HTH cro/C1-type domain-containing protein n=1 Tax=Bosea sp. NBC_00436 TaxID=2969620 RepID=A0A9E8CJZ5_9HYPH
MIAIKTAFNDGADGVTNRQAVTIHCQNRSLFGSKNHDFYFMKLYNFEAATAMLGKELDRARQHRRVTRSALAMDAGSSSVTLANLEAGRGSVASLIAVLAVLAHRFADQIPEVELGRWIARSRKRIGLKAGRRATVRRSGEKHRERLKENGDNERRRRQRYRRQPNPAKPTPARIENAAIRPLERLPGKDDDTETC